MKKYNRDNCNSLVRKVHISTTGVIIQMQGKFAFEYSVIICKGGKISLYAYKNRKDATEEFNRLIKIYK